MITELELERREHLDWWGNPPKLNKYDDEIKSDNTRQEKRDKRSNFNDTKWREKQGRN